MALVFTEEAANIFSGRRQTNRSSPRRVPFILRAASGRLSLKADAEPGSPAPSIRAHSDQDAAELTNSFNDDLYNGGIAMDWTLTTIEGMLDPTVRPEDIKCDSRNAKLYRTLLQRLQAAVEDLLGEDIIPARQTLENSKSMEELKGHENSGDAPSSGPGSSEVSVASRRTLEPIALPASSQGHGVNSLGSPNRRSSFAYEVSKNRASQQFSKRDAKIQPAIEEAEDCRANGGDGEVAGEASLDGSERDDGSHLVPITEVTREWRKTRYEWLVYYLKHFIPPVVMPVGEKYIKDKFEALDADSSGELDRDEVEGMLLQEGLNAEEVKEIMVKFDADGDGVIQWVEFKVAIMSSDVWTRNLSFSERVYLTFDDPSSSGLAKLIFSIVFWAILIAVLSMILESLTIFRNDKLSVDGKSCSDCLVQDEFEAAVDGGADRSDLLHCKFCEPEPMHFFAIIEAVTVPIFTLEYMCRLSTYHAVQFMDLKVSQSDVPDSLSIKEKLTKTMHFVADPLNILDLLAIMPFYMALIFNGDDSGSGFGAARVFRLARIFRVFKLGKTNDGMKMFMVVMARSYNALRIILFFLILSMVLFGCIIFEVEKGEWVADGRTVGLDGCDRGCFIRKTTDGVSWEISPFTDIPISFWWVLVTQTTVGFGDMYPTSRLGHAVGIITMVMGILVLALPITVIGANFAGEYANREQREQIYEEAKGLTPRRLSPRRLSKESIAPPQKIEHEQDQGKDEAE